LAPDFRDEFGIVGADGAARPTIGTSGPGRRASRSTDRPAANYRDRRHAAPARVMPILKANAYGHGSSISRD
jgi:hypothetical protein